ncbi:DUF2461 domain-containing protein [Arcicella sp. LKC2W]|uniref:DUF2461 domain-containing protein n=1 Tax=Arcicella sp. LKC2W TaxID=2984198 RepID=UPI002B22048F|nr:DUF2461 domain-containing protein [Arcicella sp. LKC2W]MEA5458508.1 DUF2461 domain-containing protein [Arcicella sp. LKC2W]
MSITNNTFEFLKDLKNNNNREWFHANKKRYDHVKATFEETIKELIVSIGEFENMTGVQVKDCNYRIARDVRFSLNKDPYKTWLSASFSEGGRKSGKMDYYLHIQEGESFLGGGMYSPTPQQLAKLRQEIDYNAKELKDIIFNPDFVKVFGEAEGEAVKSAPKGYSKDHPEIDLLRKKQIFYWHKFTKEEVCSPDFVKNVTEVCRTLKPYLDFLNYVFFENQEPEIDL